MKRPLTLSKIDVDRLARRLSQKLLPFAPDLVVYIEQGGKSVGQAVAAALEVPALGLDISYPLSRDLNRAPRILQGLLWPAKELVYRFSSPKLNCGCTGLNHVHRVALVDDSASSGHSVQTAVSALAQAGIHRSQIRVAVIRSGLRARKFVDFFEIEQPVLFVDRFG